MRTLIVAVLGLVAARAAVAQEIKDNAYTNGKLGVRLVVPKEWKIEKGEEDSLCTFSLGEDVVGELEIDESSDRTPEKEADLTEEGYRQAEGIKSFTRAKDEKLKRPAGEWLLREYVAEHAKLSLHYVFLYVKKGDALFTLTVSCDEGGWKKHQDAIAKVVDGFAFLDAKTAPAGPWKGCGPGTWVKYRVVKESPSAAAVADPKPERSEHVAVHVLVEQDAESYTVRIDEVWGETKREGKPQKVLPADKPRVDEKAVVEEGEETLQDGRKGGGQYKCTWAKVTRAGEGWTKVWTCDDVPGRVVRQHSDNGRGVKVEMTLVEFEKK